MKRLFFILVGAALTTGAMAQTPEKKEEISKKKSEKQLKNAVAEKKEEKHEVANDLKKLKIDKAIDDRKDVRAQRKIIHRRARHLKQAHGSKHPIRKAQKQLKAEKAE